MYYRQSCFNNIEDYEMPKILSFEILNEKIKISEGEKKGNQLHLIKCVWIKMPQEYVLNGRIKYITSAAELIKLAIRDNGLKGGRAVLLINTNSAFIRKIELPYLKNSKDRMSMIKFSLGELVSFDISQYTIINKISQIYEQEGVTKASYIVYGLPASLPGEYTELFKILKLQLISVDIPQNALENITRNNLLINDGRIESRCTAYLNLADDSTIFTVLNSGINVFTKTFYEDSGMKSEVIEEVNRCIRFFNSANKKNKIEKIYIYGTGADIELGNDINNITGIDTELIKSISSILFEDKDAEKMCIAEFLNGCLAMFWTKNSTNFLNEADFKHRLKFYYGVFALAVALTAILILSFKSFGNFLEKSAIEKETAKMVLFLNDERNIEISNRTEENKKIIESMEEYTEKIKELNEEILDKGKIDSEILKDIDGAVPPNSRLNSIIIETDRILLQCNSVFLEEPVLIIKNLKAVEYIKNVHIPSIDAVKQGKNILYSYSVVCNLKDVIKSE
jgi:Tfp pilus assembly PilM family ATPase